MIDPEGQLDHIYHIYIYFSKHAETERYPADLSKARNASIIHNLKGIFKKYTYSITTSLSSLRGSVVNEPN